MTNNTISVIAYLVDGGVINLLENETAKESIEQYFLTDTRPPVDLLSIKVKTNDGKEVTLNIGQRIDVSIK
jgi:hypothetical protein